MVTAAGIAVVEAIEEDNLLENGVAMGEYTRNKIEQLKQKYHVIEQIRGVGLMIGITLNVDGSRIVSSCLEKGLRINCTQGNILRFMPAMIVTKKEIDIAIEILDEVLSKNKGNS